MEHSNTMERVRGFLELERRQRDIMIKSSKLFIEKSIYFIESNRGLLGMEQADGFVREILHSVFFLGFINRPSVYPNDVLQRKLMSLLRDKYPQVFETYKTHLPLRPPYSTLLDVVVVLSGHQDPESVRKHLLDLNRKMFVPREGGNQNDNDFCLAATVISHCYFKSCTSNTCVSNTRAVGCECNSKRTSSYYGASIACKGVLQREIFIALSCIHTWNRNVARAVCLADSTNTSTTLPKFVYSEAFRKPTGNSGEYRPIPPCLRCMNVFPSVRFTPTANRNTHPPYWPYGNCAENEAISKLLDGEEEVCRSVDHINTGQPSLEELLQDKKTKLANALKKTKFELEEFIFYNSTQ